MEIRKKKQHMREENTTDTKERAEKEIKWPTRWQKGT